MSKTIKKFITRADHGGCYFEAEFIDEFKKELHLRINDDIEQSLHDELVKLGWTPPKKENE